MNYSQKSSKSRAKKKFRHETFFSTKEIGHENFLQNLDFIEIIRAENFRLHRVFKDTLCQTVQNVYNINEEIRCNKFVQVILDL